MTEIYTIAMRALLEEQRNELEQVSKRISELRRQGHAPMEPKSGATRYKSDFMYKPAKENEELYRLERRKPTLELRIQYLKEIVK